MILVAAFDTASNWVVPVADAAAKILGMILWPAITVYLSIAFRKQIITLLDSFAKLVKRIKRIRYGKGEVVVFPEVVDPFPYQPRELDFSHDEMRSRIRRTSEKRKGNHSRK